jgi:hypothetical protein
MGEVTNVYTIFVENLRGRDHSGHLGEDSRIILKCIVGKYVGRL